MEKLKKGDKLSIHCYKHNGRLHRIWEEVIVLDVFDNQLVCGNNKVKIIEADGRSHRTNEPAIIFLNRDKWFHVTAQLKKIGLFYKCDIASPFLIDDNYVKYIDYDLDLRVFPDGGFRILDRNEYAYHKKIMKYTDDIDRILKKELSDLIQLKRSNAFPFDSEIVKKYHEEYKKLVAKK